jgi:ribosome-associated translation inhibitor RaiA
MVRPADPATVADSLHVEGDLRPFEVRKLVDRWSKLDARLRSFRAGSVRLELHLKDRDLPSQQVLLEAHIDGRNALVATSTSSDLDHALNEVRDEMIRRISDAKQRSEPRNNKHLRTS